MIKLLVEIKKRITIAIPDINVCEKPVGASE